MNNIKCAECGLVNWATELECKRCKSLLTVQDNQADQLIAYAPEARPFFSTGLKILCGVLGLAIVMMVVSRVAGLEHTDFAMVLSVVFLLTGILLMVIAHIWLIIRIFEQSIGWGLGSLAVPLVFLIAIIKFWDNTKRSFVGQWLCFGIAVAGAFISADL